MENECVGDKREASYEADEESGWEMMSERVVVETEKIGLIWHNFGGKIFIYRR